jgi:hypothetical protein
MQHSISLAVALHELFRLFYSGENFSFAFFKKNRIQLGRTLRAP